MHGPVALEPSIRFGQWETVRAYTVGKIESWNIRITKGTKMVTNNKKAAHKTSDSKHRGSRYPDLGDTPNILPFTLAQLMSDHVGLVGRRTEILQLRAMVLDLLQHNEEQQSQLDDLKSSNASLRDSIGRKGAELAKTMGVARALQSQLDSMGVMDPMQEVQRLKREADALMVSISQTKSRARLEHARMMEELDREYQSRKKQLNSELAHLEILITEEEERLRTLSARTHDHDDMTGPQSIGYQPLDNNTTQDIDDPVAVQSHDATRTAGTVTNDDRNNTGATTGTEYEYDDDTDIVASDSTLLETESATVGGQSSDADGDTNLPLPLNTTVNPFLMSDAD